MYVCMYFKPVGAFLVTNSIVGESIHKNLGYLNFIHLCSIGLSINESDWRYGCELDNPISVTNEVMYLD